MRTFSIRPLRWILAGLFCAQHAPAWALAVQATNFSAGPVTPGTPLVLELDRFPAAGEGTLAMFVGTQDVGGMIKVTGERQLTFPANEYPLPPGKTEVIVYLIADPQHWQEVARLPVEVAVTEASPPVAGPSTVFKPKLDVVAPFTRSEERKTGQVQSSTTHTDAVGNLQAGLQYQHKDDGWDVRAEANLAGSTRREQALRFGTRGRDADRIDLASYVLEGGFRDTRVTLGQVTVSGNPLIAGSIANRGLAVTQRLNPWVDVSVSSQNGATIVGFDRLFGIYDNRSNFTTGTLGIEAIPTRPRGLRFEVSYLDAALKGAPSVNASSVLASEQSQGLGLRMLGSTADGRLVGDLAYGVSRYESVRDAFTPSTPSKTRDAYIADLGYALVQGAEVAPNWPLTLGVRARREYAQPLYRSLGAGFAADFEQDALSLNGTLGAAQAGLQWSRRKDNLDRVANLLQNHVESTTLTVALPLQQALSTPTAQVGPWWPALSLSAQHIHQFATNAPPDFPVASIPDIVTTVLSAGATWSIDRWNGGVSVNRNLQDNQADGAQNKDIRTITYNLNLGWRALDTLMLTAGYGPTRTLLTDTQLTRTTYNPNAGFSWTLDGGWTLAGNYNFDRSTDSQNLADSRGYGINTSVTKDFEVQAPWGLKHRGQLSLRHFINTTTSRTAADGVLYENRVRTSGIVLTVSLNFF